MPWVGLPSFARAYVDALGRTQFAVDGPGGTWLVTRHRAGDPWEVWKSDTTYSVARTATAEQGIAIAAKRAGVDVAPVADTETTETTETETETETDATETTETDTTDPKDTTAMPETVYHVCPECAYALLNHDYSAFEGFEDIDMQDTDTDYARVQAFAESTGFLADAGRAAKPGYWECESCWQVQIGSAYALEAVR